MSSYRVTVVLAASALPGVLPAAAWPALRVADEVYASGELPEETRTALDAKAAPSAEQLLARGYRQAIVLVAADRSDRIATALLSAGAARIDTPKPGLIQAVEVMDRLRSAGGCPWDAEQTHESLKQYLVEETYELLDAIEQRDRPAMREELGDVLLQVLFHARIAAEHATQSFDVDTVAAELVAKLVSRHPHVFADSERVISAEQQNRRWEELKQAEKLRESIVDGVALGQPATALAGKLGQRTGRMGIPLDLFPDGSDRASELFRIAATARRAGIDPEGELRAVAKEFALAVRAAESAARDDGIDPGILEADGWRRYWPR